MIGLAEAIKEVPGQPASVRVGMVTSVSPFIINIQGTLFGDVGVVGSYVPRVGDVVAAIGQCSNAGSDPASWMVVGTLGQPTMQASSLAVTFTTLASFTTVVTFPVPFARTPSVSTNINSLIGATANWQSRAAQVTATQFTLFVFGPSSSWAAVDVQWQAQIQTP